MTKCELSWNQEKSVGTTGSYWKGEEFTYQSEHVTKDLSQVGA